MYSFQSRVRYSELNHCQGSLPCSSIINYFQDCSTFQSEDINLGFSYLDSISRVWLLNGWQLKLSRPAKLGEVITVSTWPYAFKGFYGYRNFIMKSEKEEVLAVANSTWVYIDTVTGRPTKIPVDNAGYTLEPPYPMEYGDRKVELPVNMVTLPVFSIRKSNIDSYNHVNNGQYVKMAEEYLPRNFIVQSMRIEYRMQAVLGDIVIPKISEEGCIKVVLTNEAGKTFAAVEFQGGYAK